MLFHVSSEGRLSIAGRRAKPHYAPAARSGRRARLVEARRVVTETRLDYGRAKRALAARRAAGARLVVTETRLDYGRAKRALAARRAAGGERASS
eukprot:tig00000123_g6912.t1